MLISHTKEHFYLDDKFNVRATFGVRCISSNTQNYVSTTSYTSESLRMKKVMQTFRNPLFLKNVPWLFRSFVTANNNSAQRASEWDGWVAIHFKDSSIHNMEWKCSNASTFAYILLFTWVSYRVDVLRDGGGRVDPLLRHLRPPHPVLQRRPAVVLRPARPGRTAAHGVGGRLNGVDSMTWVFTILLVLLFNFLCKNQKLTSRVEQEKLGILEVARFCYTFSS